MDKKYKKIDQYVSDTQQSIERTQVFLNNVLKNSKDALYYFDIKTEQCNFISDSIEALTGYTPQEVLDQGVKLLIESLHPDDQPAIMELYLGLLNNTVTDSTLNVKYRTYHKNGTYFWHNHHLNIIRDENENIVAVIGTIKDITDQKVKEQELKASEERFKQLAEASFEGIIIHDLNQKIININQQFLDMYGYTYDEVKQTPLIELVAPQSRDTVAEKIASGFLGIYNTFAVKKDGTVFPVLVNVKEAVLGNHPIRIVSTFDVTEHERYQQQLKAVFESSQDCILVWDRDYNYLYANQAAIDHVDTTRDKVIGKNIRDGLGHIPDFMHLWMSRIDKVFKTQKPLRVEDAVLVGDNFVYSESVLSPICYPGGDMFAVSVVYRDITEQKQLQQQLANSEQKYRELYKNAPAAIFRSRISDGTLVDCSLATAILFGYDNEEEYKKNFPAINTYVDPSQRKLLIEKLKKDKQVHGFEAQFKRKNGTTIWIAISAEIFPEEDYMEGIMVDVTINKALTAAEKKILDIIMQGKSNKEIARELNRSIRTIEDHRSHIMHKLGADNLIDLTQKVLSLPNPHNEDSKK